MMDKNPFKDTIFMLIERDERWVIPYVMEAWRDAIKALAEINEPAAAYQKGIMIAFLADHLDIAELV